MLATVGPTLEFRITTAGPTGSSTGNFLFEAATSGLYDIPLEQSAWDVSNEGNNLLDFERVFRLRLTVDAGHANFVEIDNKLTVNPFPFPDGDFDSDFDVDGNDFLTWQRDPTFGDLADWKANYATPAPLAAAATAVPASDTALLFCLGLANCVIGRRSGDRPQSANSRTQRE